MVENVFAADPAPGSGQKGNVYSSEYETDAEISALQWNICCKDFPQKKNNILSKALVGFFFFVLETCICVHASLRENTN